MLTRGGTFPCIVRVVWTGLDSGSVAVGTRGTTVGLGSIARLAEVPLEWGYLRYVHPSQCPSANCCWNLGIWCTVTVLWKLSRSLPGRSWRVGCPAASRISNAVHSIRCLSPGRLVSVVFDDRARICGSRHRFFLRVPFLVLFERDELTFYVGVGLKSGNWTRSVICTSLSGLARFVSLVTIGLVLAAGVYHFLSEWLLRVPWNFGLSRIWKRNWSL